MSESCDECGRLHGCIGCGINWMSEEAILAHLEERRETTRKLRQLADQISALSHSEVYETFRLLRGRWTLRSGAARWGGPLHFRLRWDGGRACEDVE